MLVIWPKSNVLDIAALHQVPLVLHVVNNHLCTKKTISVAYADENSIFYQCSQYW